MKKHVLAVGFFLASCLLLPAPSYAQFTTVTATVKDPNGIPYAGAVLNAVLVPSTGGGYTLSGQPYSGRIGPVTLDSTGKFTVNFGDVTLITPGSVNTAMGIARVIRERLQPHHRYFVVEMGAYGIGSIRRLCELTPPHLGIISAVGKAHYERFKSLETVAEAKFELAEAVAVQDGTVIVAADTLSFAAPQRFAEAYPGMLVTVGDGRSGSSTRSALFFSPY